MENGVPFVTSKCLKENGIDFSQCKYISKSDADSFNKRSFVDDKDILFAMIGTIGNATIVNKNRDFAIKNVALFKNIKRDLLSEEWIKVLLDSFSLKMKEKTSSGLQPFVSLDFLRNYLVPIPPAEEQKRILSLLREVFLKVGIIQSDLNQIEVVCKKIKDKILELYFGENSSYKSYYGSRTYTTLSKLIPSNKIGDGDWVLSENMDENGEYRIVQLKHIGKGCYVNKPYKCINKNFFENNSCSEIKPSFLLINRLVSEEMDACLLPSFSYKTITSVDVCWIAPDEKYDQKYLMYYFLSPAFQSQVLLKSSGSTRRRISKKNLINIPIQIHNLDDQKMIVKDIEQYFELLNSIIE